MAEPSPARIDESQFLDPRWRLSNLYTITDKAGRQVPFRPNSAQIAFLDELHSANLILKARQLGFPTLCCLIYLDACVFTPNTRASSACGPIARSGTSYAASGRTAPATTTPRMAPTPS